MATIKANGGAASVWEHPKGLRVVLCRNGKVLTGIGPGAYHHAQSAAQRVSCLSRRPTAKPSIPTCSCALKGRKRCRSGTRRTGPD